MSIAEQQRQINEILSSSKARLRQVEESLQMLANQKLSIDDDIAILSHRAQVIKERLGKKKKALQNVIDIVAESEDAYKKLKESTKMLLGAVKKQIKKVDDLVVEQNQPYFQN